MIFYSICIVFFLFVAFLLCVVIMMQESKSAGLGSALMGGDSQDSLFGVSTAQVIKKFTAWMIGIFLFMSALLSFWTGSIGEKTPFKPRIEHQAPVQKP